MRSDNKSGGEQSLPLRPISVDFEYIPQSDGSLEVVCVVARDLRTGELTRRWRDELGTTPPYPIGPDAVLVAYNAQAEMEAHLSLGWPIPVNILDLYAEHMLDTNGPIVLPHGMSAFNRGSLLAALKCNGLGSDRYAEKRQAIERILAGPPYSADERAYILDYCQEDVDDARDLLAALAPRLTRWSAKWFQQALVRGRYSVALAYMKRNGYPVDVELHDRIIAAWSSIRAGLITEAAPYQVFENGKFSHDRFEVLLCAHGADVHWPTTPSGQRNTDEKVWREMASLFPLLEPLRELTTTLAQMKKIQPLGIGPDGRARIGMPEIGFARLGLELPGRLSSPGWGAYRSKTGRNQPTPKEFLPVRANWWRELITPREGRVLIYADWSAQEIGIAAALSGDEAMAKAYHNDPYLSFARTAGLVPPDATKATHGEYRNKVMKAVVLGTLYGQKEYSLGLRIGRHYCEARQLLRQYAQTYPDFTAWIRDTLDRAELEQQIQTRLGWRMLVGDHAENVREGGRKIEIGTRTTTLLNWPMQAHGAEILRVACIGLADLGILTCFPLHDAVLVECDETDTDEVSRVVCRTMEKASRAVLGGFTIPADVEVVRPGESLRDERKGGPMWARIKKFIL